MKKLYTVTIERTLIVLASDEADAEEIAHDHEQDVFDETVFAHPMNSYPAGWGDDEIPFGDADDPEREDWNIGQWIDAGAAEPMRVYRERRKAKARGETPLASEGGK